MVRILVELEQALEHHKKGELDRAKGLYEKVITIEPENYLALYFLGLVCLSQKQVPDALDLISRSVNIYPYKDNCLALADIYFGRSDFNAAVVYYQKALSFTTNDYALLNKLAHSHFNLGAIEQAIKMFDRAVQINPQFAEGYYNLGIMYEKLKDFRMSLVAYEKALKINPNYKEAIYNAGLMCLKLGENEGAKNLFLKAKALNLGIAALDYNLGVVNFNIKNFESALDHLHRAIQKRKDYADAYNIIGNIYAEQYLFDEALHNYNKALELKPENIESLNGLTWTYLNLRQRDKSEYYIDKALKQEPKNPEANFHSTVLKLMHGDYNERTWHNYEYRFHLKEFNEKQKVFNQPQWQGECLKGKTIYVYFEQGLGDTVMFFRCLGTLVSMGANVIFRPQDSLASLLKTNTIGVNITDCNVNKPTFAFDYHCPLMSLPYKLGLKPEDAKSTDRNYINIDKNKTEDYRQKYFSTEGTKVGIFWQGNPKGLQNRSIKLQELSEIFRVDGIQFYSLQKGYGTEQLQGVQYQFDIVDLGSTFSDFSDTAAAIDNLDLLITIDTSIAHLAGMMGKQTWLLLPYVPEWRWGLTGENTHWYKNVRLFRQSSLNSWQDVVTEVFQALDTLSSSNIK